MAVTRNRLIRFAAGLMLATGCVYFYEAFSEAQEFGSELAAQVETMFFATAGILYIPFGVWMLKDGLSSRAPYIISMIGSLALIGLYLASRSVSLPIVGLQEDIGLTDLLSKFLQGGIIVACAVLVARQPRSRVAEARAG